MVDYSRQALVGVIGGTYISLAITDIDELTIANFALLNSADFKNPMDAIERYLTSVPRCPDKVGLAVTGTVSGDSASLTHHNWIFDKNDVRAATGSDHATLISDAEALALSLPHLTDYDLVEISLGERALYANKVVIIAGTGLSVTGLVHVDDKWNAIAGDGGGVGFLAPAAGEFDLRTAFAADAFVSAGDVFSGHGLVTLYSALARSSGQGPQLNTAPKIVELGLARKDPLAAEALELIATWLGRFAGDMALTFGARGGVFLAGGLAANIVPALTTGRFRAAFEAKGKFGPYLEKIAINAIKTGADAGLRGTAVAVARSVASRSSLSRRPLPRAS